MTDFIIRAYGWQELAIEYAPDLTPESVDPAPSGYHRRVSRRTLAGRIKYLPVSEWVGTYSELGRDLFLNN